MEAYIIISFLNDFIFCPKSIYYHQLYSTFDTSFYHKTAQLKGLSAHKTIDKKTYSTEKKLLIGQEVFCEKYNLCGKIDLFDTDNGILTERKREVKIIYDGYVFQVYAQYFALMEMGYKVKKIIIHDLLHNKNYPIELPENNQPMYLKFEQLIKDINEFDLEGINFIPKVEKCNQCIYNHLCDSSLC